MKKVLIIGAGRSSYNLISYLVENASTNDWQIKIVDQVFSEDISKFGASDRVVLENGDIMDVNERGELIEQSDIVISMLPATLHMLVARDCLRYKKNLVTASYVSDEMRSLSEEVERNGLIFVNECGLDPGIDHMSAMKVINELREKSLELTAFETFTGGLLAPNNSKYNPWEYKFTWNPRNVVLAGTGVVKFMQEGKFKFIPYHKLFRRTEPIFIEGYGQFEGYANRDSLKYLDIYGLRGINTLYRGTLRRPGYSKTWDIFVQLGATDDTYQMEGVSGMTHREFLNSFLSYNPNDSVELKLAHYMSLDLDGPEMARLKWSGFFDHDLVGLKAGTPAQVLEHILKKKWTLDPSEQDMIVMWHKFNYIENGKNREIHSRFVVQGEDQLNTAMSKTVGLPVAIVTKLILQDKINLRGVRIPIYPELYNPILEELKEMGIDIKEVQVK